MKIRLVAIIAILALLTGVVALGEGYHINEANGDNFGILLVDLMHAYEKPSSGDAETVRTSLEQIRAVDENDYELALAIARHWYTVYVDPEGQYRLCLYRGGEQAEELEQSGLVDSPSHAFVVLGYELKNGEMTQELMGRCDAAAAAARSFPQSVLICSGGATGSNNPLNHTEAGLMRDYLVEKCGIDASRIFIDENAMTTLQNAVNTFEIMRAQGIETMTVVTSSYHQKWGQVLYNAMAAMQRLDSGYSVEIVGNYSYEIKAPDRYRQDDRYAVRQLTAMLDLPETVLELMKERF